MSEESDNGIIEGIKKALKERFGSLMYGTFIASWCIWNWTALYITFFLDENLIFQKFNRLKVEYLVYLYRKSYIFGINFEGFWTKFTYLFLGPFISTLIIIWILSWLDRIFQRKGCDNRFKSKQIEIAHKIRSQTLEYKELRSENLEYGQQIEKIKREKEFFKELPNERKWDIEYENLKDDRGFDEKMARLQQLLYHDNGYITDLTNSSGGSGLLAFYDVNQLIEKRDVNHVQPTEKGKYFIKKSLHGARPR